MSSYKTIKVNDFNIKFTFDTNYVRIQINDTAEFIRYHNEFINTLQDLNLPNSQNKKIRYWFHKNYKKLYPNQEYTTRYGRKINMDHHSHQNYH